MVKLKKGYVQVYTGNGKGKTTAAIGLAVRAAGSGLKVYIAQFMKGSKYSEIRALEKLKSNITVKQYGSGHFIKKGQEPDEKDRELAQACLKEVRGIIASGIYDVVILDEIGVAQYFKLCSVADIIDLIDAKPENVELILTGRKTDGRIIEKADLVTEMREIKHYYSKGVPARKGIER
jgi:cob(I)alamin adenosyltransferase